MSEINALRTYIELLLAKRSVRAKFIHNKNSDITVKEAHLCPFFSEFKKNAIITLKHPVNRITMNLKKIIIRSLRKFLVKKLY